MQRKWGGGSGERCWFHSLLISDRCVCVDVCNLSSVTIELHQYCTVLYCTALQWSNGLNVDDVCIHAHRIVSYRIYRTALHSAWPHLSPIIGNDCTFFNLILNDDISSFLFTIPYHAMPCYNTSCYDMSCYDMLCLAISHHVSHKGYFERNLESRVHGLVWSGLFSLINLHYT